MMKRSLATVVALGAICGSALGQGAARVEPTIVRARQRAAAGDSAAARVILDSLLAATIENAVSRAEVVYWSAQLAPSSVDRERRLAMLVIDYPFSPRVRPVLFELGMIELAHGDREGAAIHLARFLTGGGADSNRTTAALALGRLLLDREDRPRACAVLLAGRAEVLPSAVEIRNQFDFSTTACRGVDTSVVPPPATPPPSDTTVVAPQALGGFTVQVAAYELKGQADRLATRLRRQGLEARVIGATKPFRVRVGHYQTHAEADAAAHKIDALAKLKTFVVLIGPEEK